mmetsp:Transcript_15348/g.27197  ORF Transcript_15348/g.27197 Transcript_15348/m.27197 type:complete len:95 (-) Transcript_15348:142-426(-)
MIVPGMYIAAACCDIAYISTSQELRLTPEEQERVMEYAVPIRKYQALLLPTPPLKSGCQVYEVDEAEGIALRRGGGFNPSDGREREKCLRKSLK